MPQKHQQKQQAEHFVDWGEIFDGIPDAVLVFDREGQVLAGNSAAERLFGYPRDAIEELDVASLFRSASGEPVWLEGGVGGVSHRPLNLNARHRDGRDTPVQLSLKPGNDSAEYRIATVRIMDEDVLRLAGIFEYSYDGIFVVDPETEYITDANPRACKMLGYDRSELVGAHVSVVHPEEMKQLRAFFQHVMKHGHGQTSELSCSCDDGRRLETEIAASVADFGTKKHVVAMVRDVSEQRELRHRLSRLATLPRDNPDPVVELDLSGVVHYVNPRAAEEFPTLERDGGAHPFCRGIDDLVEEMRRDGEHVTQREIEIGDATYSQRIHVDTTLNLCRIYAHDLTERKRVEELHKQLELAEATKSATLDTILRLSNAAEYRDEDTGAHIRRMAHFSAAIARRMGLDEETVELVLYASPMHDIGKIGIPDRILLKPGRLTEEEMAIMRRHTDLGAEILANSDSPLMQTAERIALTHHEKWDGTGYPRGLAGADIPLAGRIVAVADVYDALTSRRPYKEPFSPETTLEMMRKDRDSHFCPDVLDAFLDIQPEIAHIAAQYPDTQSG